MILLLVLLAGAIAYSVAYALIRHAAWLRLLDVPNRRSSHSTATPRGGGMGIFAAGTSVGMYLVYQYSLPLGWQVLVLSTVIAATGFLDDLYSLSARARFAIQTLCCALLLVAALTNQTWPTHFMIGLQLGLVLVLGVWWINLFNFMDGIDGIAATQAIFMLGAAALIASASTPNSQSEPVWLWMVATLAGVMGFLLLNWPPARIFMGDVGSTYLAFMIFSFAIISISDNWLHWSTWVILGAAFAVDATITLLTRMLRGEKWHQAHRSHAYQRLARRWASHRSVVALLIAFNILWVLPLAFSTMYWDQFQYAAIMLAYAPPVAGVLLAGGGQSDVT
ncbi:MraY family glycosyltransferase [Achromobacter pulmonis]|uniref:MraY family glycosyltransferase n=1 Tax=Achromobacter pulmonis TaxID=1389932 RepID=UPI001F451AB6|nr:glycosyltransferase family 4 protein [Achromobacter pulmonis]MCF7767863.1 glycosyltransferase family 4 protein [Achromobacter pulmonis]